MERTADFSRRLALSGPTGETRELVSTINSMIGRVERSLVAQQAFLADSSHELRRPLTVIRANVEMLFDPALPKDQREQCLTAIQEESQAMSRLIADLLLLSREKSQTISQGLVNCSAVCEAGAQRLSARDRGRHQLEVDISPGLYVLGDRERLSQLVDNLLDNAARYTAPNGRIELHAAARDGHARLTVQDTGIGIPQDEIPHVFDRFFRGIDARVLERDGSGLGLAIVKYVTEAHGGLVQVSSEPGQGTAVLVELPAVKVDQS